MCKKRLWIFHCPLDKKNETYCWCWSYLAKTYLTVLWKNTFSFHWKYILRSKSIRGIWIEWHWLHWSFCQFFKIRKTYLFENWIFGRKYTYLFRIFISIWEIWHFFCDRKIWTAKCSLNTVPYYSCQSLFQFQVRQKFV